MAVVVEPQRQLLVLSCSYRRFRTVGVIVAFKPELRERALARGYSADCSSRSGSGASRHELGATWTNIYPFGGLRIGGFEGVLGAVMKSAR
jgi:hypothetical protein